MKLSASAEREFERLIEVVDRTVPFPALDRRRLPIRVVFETDAASTHLGSTRGTTVTLYARAFSSPPMFLYAALHEVAHAVFALLSDEESSAFLSVVGIARTRWESLVIAASSDEDRALQKAAVHEIELVAETFAEAYAEYWTKTSYLEARSSGLYDYMRRLFWTTRGVTHGNLDRTRSGRSPVRCLRLDREPARVRGRT